MDPVPLSCPVDDEPVELERQPSSHSLLRSQFIDDEAMDVDSDESSSEQPDLAEYFSQWEISDAEQIRLCRSYASYLVAMKKDFAKK